MGAVAVEKKTATRATRIDRLELARRVALAREIEIREKQDPLSEALKNLTRQSNYGAGNQWDFVHAADWHRVAEGGNQSGKTYLICVDFLLQALGMHPTRKWVRNKADDKWKGWYSTTTYQRFAEQGWHHFKHLLFYPDEEAQDGSRRVIAIGYDKKNPERVTYLKLRRVDGGIAEINIKSYEQGDGEFQSAEVDCLALDEECNNSIYKEAVMRLMARAGNMIVSATAVKGVDWLDKLRTRAEEGRNVFHCRLDLRDNPTVGEEEIRNLQEEFGDDPDELALRMSGYPRSRVGLIYGDRIFTPKHIVDPFDIPGDWTRYRSIDPGFNFCGCLWLAVSPDEDSYVYRDYKGEQRTIGENCAAIAELSGDEVYHRSWIDPAAMGRKSESGRREIDLWNDEGVQVTVAPDNAVRTGIEEVQRLLKARGGINGERPIHRVFRDCCEMLEERRLYRRADDAGKDGRDFKERVIKRHDHLMDPWRYSVVAGLRYVLPKAKKPKAGTLGRRLYEKRRAAARKNSSRI